MITEADCIKVLENYLRKPENIKLIKFEIKPISENLEGFMGEHSKLLITHEVNNKLITEIFFLKTIPLKNQAQQKMVLELGMYKREIFAYDFLLKEFKKYGFDTSFAANSYHCLSEGALVLEDLTLKSYSVTDRHEMLSLDQLKLGLKALALFHAAGFAFDKLKTKVTKRKFCLGDEYNECMNESFYVKYVDPKAFGMRWMRSIENLSLALIPLLPGSDEYRQHFSELYHNFESGKIFVEDTNINKTCGHGDLWSNNLMFRYENNRPVDCCLLDFQILRYFYPCLDVILLIFCNTNAAFRKNHLEYLYKCYHNILGETLSNYGYCIQDIHPWSDFNKSISIVKPDALTQVLLTKCIVNLPKENMSNLVDKEEEEFTELMFNNHELVADSFKNDEVYREEITEIMTDFYDALNKKN